MTEPKISYSYTEPEFGEEAFEISANYNNWEAGIGKLSPIFIEIVEDADNTGEIYSSMGMGISLAQAKEIIADLTTIVTYLEESND